MTICDLPGGGPPAPPPHAARSPLQSPLPVPGRGPSSRGGRRPKNKATSPRQKTPTPQRIFPPALATYAQEAVRIAPPREDNEFCTSAEISSGGGAQKHGLTHSLTQLTHSPNSLHSHSLFPCAQATEYSVQPNICKRHSFAGGSVETTTPRSARSGVTPAHRTRVPSTHATRAPRVSGVHGRVRIESSSIILIVRRLQAAAQVRQTVQWWRHRAAARHLQGHPR